MRHVFLVVVGCVMATWIAIAQQERPVTDDLLRMAPAKGEEWLTYGVDQGERRFSPLSQINVNNVGRLGLASGARVKVSSRRGSAVVEAVADEGVPRGSVVAWFNQPGFDAATLVDGDAVVTAVRIDTVTAGEA